MTPKYGPQFYASSAARLAAALAASSTAHSSGVGVSRPSAAILASKLLTWAAAVMSEIDDERKLYEEYAMVDALGERRFARGERAWWVPKNAVRPDHDAQIAVTVLRTGKVWATVIVAMNGSGHWYTQRARIDDMRLRTEYLAVDAIADKGLEQLP